jgi:hypothetical protein
MDSNAGSQVSLQYFVARNIPPGLQKLTCHRRGR